MISSLWMDRAFLQRNARAGNARFRWSSLPRCGLDLAGAIARPSNDPRLQGLTDVGKFATIGKVTKNTRPIRWMKAARKDFEDFPQAARDDLLDALTAVADGGHPTIAKPLTGLGSGVVELALRHRGDAFRVVYALQIGADVWVIHAFQKKSKTGVATPRQEIDLVRERLRRLKEILG
jgi:phage-related protein